MLENENARPDRLAWSSLVEFKNEVEYAVSGGLLSLWNDPRAGGTGRFNEIETESEREARGSKFTEAICPGIPVPTDEITA